ncbi:MAG: DUF5343 domain-containing protein [Pseudomonadota bacterium]
MASLPYVTAPGNIDKALVGIKTAATPASVSQDFVKTILKIPGGSGDQITSFLKKIGFAGTDGTPTSIYTQFRNAATSGAAAAAAIKHGFAPLYVRNEYMHQLSDEALKGLIIEETGAAENSSIPGLVLSAINSLKSVASFEAPEPDETEVNTNDASVVQLPPVDGNTPPTNDDSVGLNLSYTINLNLPATSDIAVFNAIFKSLKENLLKK